MRVLVIGGGIVGLTIAREFQRRKDSEVILFEKGKLGREASYAAAGMLAPQAESDADDAFFRFCVAAREFYVDFAAEIESESGIPIDLDCAGTLYAAFDEAELPELSERYEWQAAAAHEVEKLTALETRKFEPFVSPETTGSLFFPNDWQVENRKLVHALVECVNQGETTIYQDSGVRALRFGADSVRGVITENGELFDADLIVLATGAWTSLIETGRSSFALPDIEPVRGQMISFQTAKRLLTRVVYSPRGYVVPRNDGRILAGATVEHTGYENTVTESGKEGLKRNAVEIVPRLENLAAADAWSGLRPYAANGLPLIGELPECSNLFISTGHYRNGILLAPLSARLLVESVYGKKGLGHIESFSPGRNASAAAIR